MMKKLSEIPLLRHGNRLLFGLFCALIISVLFVGLDNMAGYVLSYLASVVLFYMCTRGWRSIKRFAILSTVSLIGIFFLSFLYVEVISRLAIMVGGFDALNSTTFRVIELVITYVIMFAGPVGLFYGIVGILTLGVIRLVTLKRRHGAVGGA
jgi:hypothetical protein